MRNQPNADEKITVQAVILADKQKVWDYYTQPEHITKWNFASDDWCCPYATNDLRVGGKYIARMEAKDGSWGLDFEATYIEVNPLNYLTYEFGGRFAKIEFHQINKQPEQTEILITFDPETEYPIDVQRKGWQAILDNFKKYVETH